MKLCDFANAGDVSACEIAIDILQVFLEFCKALTLGRIVGIIFEISQPYVSILPVHISDGFHANKLHLFLFKFNKRLVCPPFSILSLPFLEELLCPFPRAAPGVVQLFCGEIDHRLFILKFVEE